MNRREMLKAASATTLAALTPSAPAVAQRSVAESTHNPVPQWEVFELNLSGPSSGNPFTDIQFTGTFTLGNRTVDAEGFYDGGGTYKLRFMPDTEGQWSYRTNSNARPPQ